MAPQDPTVTTTTSPAATSTQYTQHPHGFREERVPYKTILATIALVIATYLAWMLFQRLSHILELIVIAMFFALALNPAVDFLEHRAQLRRGAAAFIVFLCGILLLGALTYLFVEPLVRQTTDLVNRLPQIAHEASAGEGTVGTLVKKYNIDTYLRDNQTKLRDALQSSTGSIMHIVSAVASTIATLLTVVVIAFMMLLYGNNMLRAPLVFFRPHDQERITRVATDAAKSVTGYMNGNLFISLIAGLVSYISLELLHVNFALVLAVWVAFTDLIPLVGATLGAIPVIVVAFFHNPFAGFVSIAVYVVYQQIENHLIQPAVMSRTVNFNPLMVLLSALVGVELAGLLGALLAIPVAGALQVIFRDLYTHRSKPLLGELDAATASPIEGGDTQP